MSARPFFATDTLRDTLKLNGAGAIAIGALATASDGTAPITLAGGAVFTVGVAHAVWRLGDFGMRGITDLGDESSGSPIFANGGFFLMGLVFCAIGVIGKAL